MGRYPANEVGLKALVQPSADPRWHGPYLNSVTNGEIPLDPWGTAYVYRAPGAQGRDFDIVSYGRDRAPGGAGDDADIHN